MVSYPKQGSIVMLNFSPSVGNELRQPHPAVVVSDDMLAKNTPFIWVVPISHGNYTEFALHLTLDDRTKTSGNIYLEQMRAVDYKSRVVEFVEMVPEDIFEELRNRLRLIV